MTSATDTDIREIKELIAGNTKAMTAIFVKYLFPILPTELPKY